MSPLKSYPGRALRLLTLSLLMTLAVPAPAASVSYFLDLANELPDGRNYLQVTISDSATVAGDIDFRVALLPDAFPPAAGNFGLDRFLFNHDGSLSVSSANISGLDPAWRIGEARNAGGGYDRYAFQLKGKGNSRTSLLTFSISGVEGDSPASYATAARNLHHGATEFFAAHVGGFDARAYGASSTWSAGSTAVPIPAAVWMFASGLLGLMTLARRRNQA